MQKVKRNLLLTLLAFMLAVLSAVSFMIAPTVKADDEVKENTVVEKTVREKIEDWKKSIGEEEFAKIVAKNAPSDSVDYSAYEKISDETITNLSGIIVAVEDFNGTFNSGSVSDPEYVSSDPDLAFQIPGAASVVTFFYNTNEYSCFISPLTSEESAMFLDSDESTWLAYYIPHTIELTKMYDSTATPITVNVDELTFSIPNDSTLISFYGISETSPNEPDNPTPDNPTSGNGSSGNSNSGSSGAGGGSSEGLFSGFSFDGLTDDTNILGKIIAVVMLFGLVVLFFIIPSFKKKKRK